MFNSRFGLGLSEAYKLINMEALTSEDKLVTT